MSETIRCPSMSCWPAHDWAEVAFDGYFACDHCGKYLDHEDFLRYLAVLAHELAAWQAAIATIERRVIGEQQPGREEAT